LTFALHREEAAFHARLAEILGPESEVVDLTEILGVLSQSAVTPDKSRGRLAGSSIVRG
jgi:hypothetical protein